MVVVVEGALFAELAVALDGADVERPDDPAVLEDDPPLQAVRAIRPAIRTEAGTRLDMGLLCRGLHQNLMAGAFGVPFVLPNSG